MWVYGDQEREVTLLALLADVDAAQAALAAAAPGLDWHGRCVGLFLLLSDLLQGVADAEFAALGVDQPSAAQDSILAALIATSESIARSWNSRLADQEAPDTGALAPLRAADERLLNIRRCEGYAFYAVYPELYVTAAASLPPDAFLIGLRSIGGGLAALVAGTAKARQVVTVRPGGGHFDRRIAAGDRLNQRIAGSLDSSFVIVDEGPGLSGSSFGGTADWLEEQGVAPDRILFMPSHGGDLGPQAREDHRGRWNARPRLVATFDDVVRDGPVPLAGWFEDLTGPVSAPLQDLSGGRWRARSPWPDAPADPGREARKYLLEAEGGSFRLKFVGLDAIAAEKLGRAQSLFRAGLVPVPLALRHGFLLERWVDGRQPAKPPLAFLAPYLAFRAKALPAGAAGAPLAQLVDMARYNLSQGIGGQGARLLDPWNGDRIAALQQAVRPIHTDSRLHRWEWLDAGGTILKTDAIDHAQAHDLVGCQDIAWDIAGAAVEFDLSANQVASLAEAVMPGRPRDLIECLIPCYLAFQLGWWSYAGEPGSAQMESYAAKTRKLLEH
ncbi:hypothetical protein [Sphingosinicella sp. BN140058]|uniref:hypothetical protein n=1 Tax=Sphingosinicella sp. BN140058 TaxID=1892855 RepID=UPI00101348EE|nr:hypothetical protein [Sphingosinicella sp. BN140058]QAY75261.1 hypothetical protein ETR14_00975 [Sphingosinicella sp. BN140058]